MAKLQKEPKFNKDGSPCMRGHGAGSRATRFADGDGRARPGKSMGTRDEKSIIISLRDKPVTVVVKRDRDGNPIKTRKITTREAMYEKQREKSLKGDQKATEFLDRKFAQHEPLSVAPDLTKQLMAEDLAILADARARGVLPPIFDETNEASAEPPIHHDKEEPK